MMLSWSDQIRDPTQVTPVGERGVPDDESEDEDLAAEENGDGLASDESRRIVEEAIRRGEEAEHEWNHSWEPDKPAD